MIPGRVSVALDYLRQLTDGTPLDMAALLTEIASACPIAGPWQEVRINLAPSWSREVIVRAARGAQFPATVEAGEDGRWKAVYRLDPLVSYGLSTYHDTPEQARAACDARLRDTGWLLL